MEEISQFVVAHGYAVIVIWTLLDQMGIPIPEIPILIVAGAMSGAGQLDFGLVIRRFDCGMHSQSPTEPLESVP